MVHACFSITLLCLILQKSGALEGGENQIKVIDEIDISKYTQSYDKISDNDNLNSDNETIVIADTSFEPDNSTLVYSKELGKGLGSDDTKITALGEDSTLLTEPPSETFNNNKNAKESINKTTPVNATKIKDNKKTEKINANNTTKSNNTLLVSSKGRKSNKTKLVKSKPKKEVKPHGKKINLQKGHENKGGIELHKIKNIHKGSKEEAANEEEEEANEEFDEPHEKVKELPIHIYDKTREWDEDWEEDLPETGQYTANTVPNGGKYKAIGEEYKYDDYNGRENMNHRTEYKTYQYPRGDETDYQNDYPNEKDMSYNEGYQVNYHDNYPVSDKEAEYYEPYQQSWYELQQPNGVESPNSFLYGNENEALAEQQLIAAFGESKSRIFKGYRKRHHKGNHTALKTHPPMTLKKHGPVSGSASKRKTIGKRKHKSNKVQWNADRRTIMIGNRVCGSRMISKINAIARQKTLKPLQFFNMKGKRRSIEDFDVVNNCCDNHFKCPRSVPAKSSKYGYQNDIEYDVMDCKCDDKFRRCLKTANSNTADAVGHLYFNALKIPCLTFDEDVPNEESSNIEPPENMNLVKVIPDTTSENEKLGKAQLVVSDSEKESEIEQAKTITLNTDKNNQLNQFEILI